MTSASPDPADIEAALKRQIAQLQAELAAHQALAATDSGNDRGDRPTINTHGGAAVQGSVRVRNGHFIGRDYIQFVTQVVQTGEDPEEAKSVIALYLHALSTDLAGLKLGEIDVSADQTRQDPLHLADVYVPLDTTLRIGEHEKLENWLQQSRQRGGARGMDAAQRETRPVSALEALAAHRELTLLGPPGSGKSTFGASVLLTLAQAWQGRTDELAKLGAHWTHGALLPIRVVLRRFAEQLPAGDAPARAADLWAFIGRDLDAGGYGLSADAAKHVERIARHHGALILLDGLDECGDSKRRGRVLAAVREFMQNTGSHCRFVLTARPYAWPDAADSARGVYALADLHDAQIEAFIRAWYAALVRRHWRSPGDAQRRIDDLLRARHRADLQPLARNPLLLTLMATLHTNRGRLPDDRADLYGESVELLLLRWNRQIGADKALLDELSVPGLKLSDLREALEKLAFDIHEQSAGRDGPAEIGEDRLNRAFRPLLGNSLDKAAVVVDYIEQRAGLMLGKGEKDGERRFEFPHRTFQEFLAACHLAAHDNFAAECVRLARISPSHWSVALPLAARVARAERGASAADELISGRSIVEFRAQQTPAAADWACALLAGAQLQEIGLGALNASARSRAIVERVAGWLVALLPVHPDDGGLPAAQRARAGDVLAALGDPRFDPQRLYLPADASLGFVRIAADPTFCIGTREADKKRLANALGPTVRDDEINDKVTPAPEFLIARHAVTVAQFRAFVDATSFQVEEPKALQDPDNRPVRFVNWHEAAAYCKWLNEMLCGSPLFADHEVARLVREQGWRVALPSELEWEKAARGGLTNAIFSWGDARDPQRANYLESGIADTSAVGCFPANGYGLHDMLGNVWEWTRSLWGKDVYRPEYRYPYRTDDPAREDQAAGDHILRVVRGGSWLSPPWDVTRCAFRYRIQPDNLHGSVGGSVGFRVVLCSAPVSKC